MNSSEAPRLARPISWLNWAKAGSANRGTWPSSSWHTSWARHTCHMTSYTCLHAATGSGVYMGVLWWRMYCVEWNTLKARPARKSREDSSPATGRSWNPVTPKYFLQIIFFINI